MNPNILVRFLIFSVLWVVLLYWYITHSKKEEKINNNGDLDQEQIKKLITELDVLYKQNAELNARLLDIKNRYDCSSNCTFPPGYR